MVSFSKRRALLTSATAGLCGLPLAKLNAQTSQTSQTPAASVRSEDAQDDFAQRLQALREDAAAVERLRALVVLHRGEVVLAESFSGPSVDTGVNIKSVSKSLVAALAGCAIERGVLRDVKVTLGESIPKLLPGNADPRVPELTIEDLLTMRAGLQRTSGPFYGSWVASDNWVDYVLSRPFVDEPGGAMLYSTGDWHVLGAVLSTLSGATLLELAREWLGKPLDISFAPWTRDPQGLYMGGNEMSLSPLAMARFGELYRLQGLWQQQELFRGDWVQRSFVGRGRSPFSGDLYGYGWFLRRVAGSGFAYARGYGGQFIHVLPAEQLVVAMTSDWTRAARGGVYTEQLHSLVIRHLIAAT